MKKSVFLSSLLGMAAISVVMSGCVMCNDPIQGDSSCIEPSHESYSQIDPNNIAFTRPNVAVCTDVFKPTFEAGKERVTALGIGNSLEDATADAIKNFMEKTNCDYIVGTTRVVTVKTHPSSRWFSTSNYTVKVSGIPVTLTKLEKLSTKDIKAAPAVVAPLTKDDVKNIVSSLLIQQPKPEAQYPFGLVKLTDINIKVDAKAVAKDPAGVTFPVKEED